MESISIYLKVVFVLVGLLCGWCGTFLFDNQGIAFFIKKGTKEDYSLEISTSEKIYYGDNTTVSDQISREIRILCLVHPIESKNTVNFIRNTWGSKCNKLVFATSKIDGNGTDFIKIKYPNLPSKNNIWKNTEFVLRTVYKNYSEFYDWVLVATDDTYVVLENLRLMLTTESLKNSLVFGTGDPETNLLTRNAYVLSKTTLGKLYDAFVDSNCTTEGMDEMEILTKCLNHVGTAFGRSVDLLGRFFFNINSIPISLMNMRQTNDYLSMFSIHSVSWSGVSVKDMYVLQMFIYKIRSYELKPYKQLVQKSKSVE